MATTPVCIKKLYQLTAK